MKITVWFMLLFILIGCASTNELTEFTFYDSHGNEYNSLTAPSNLKKEFNIDVKPRMVVIATSSKSNTKYKEQIDIISKVNAEEMQYLYVVASSKEEDHSGYYVEKMNSERILVGDDFKVIVYDEIGQIVIKSTNVIGVVELKNHLTR